uniref:Uncharacterized protein n=1 Tax=viral metagenome TaxID=1070528 RepID=A0A6C0F5X2_9ZZZZ
MERSNPAAGGGEREEQPNTKRGKSQTFAERLRPVLFEVQPELSINDWLQHEDIPQMPNAVVFANGRFQGLFPKTDAEHGIGGHPGLIFRLMMVALLLGTNNIAISYSIKQDDEKNPLDPSSKEGMIRSLIEPMKEEIVALLTSRGFGETEVREKLNALNIKLFPLTNLFSTVAAVGKSFPGQKRLVMVTGLEKDKQGKDYNKYATTFKTLSGFTGVDFVLNSRQSSSTISGTEIREAVLNNYYDELGRYLLEANLTDENIIRNYGNLIYAMKMKIEGQASQTEEGYANTLLDNMILAAFEKLDRLKELELKAQEGSLNEDEQQELAYLQSKEVRLREFAVLKGDSAAGGGSSAGGRSAEYEERGEEGGKKRKQKTRKQKSKRSKKSRKGRKIKTRKIKSTHTKRKNR